MLRKLTTHVVFSYGTNIANMDTKAHKHTSADVTTLLPSCDYAGQR